jgi:zinc D-Ala-D-Ala carboxypeptidase
MGDLSRNFSRSEFLCPCGQPDRFHATVDGGLVAVLQRIRDRAARPLPVVSGVRCSAYNRLVGGAPKSQHLRGRAADIPRGYCTVAQALAAGARGVGHRGGWAIHVDVRPGPPVTFVD